jgi:hypothetical protein
MDAEKQKPKVGKKVIVCGHWSNGNRWRTIATWQPAGSIDVTCWMILPEDWWDEDGNVCTNPTDEWSESPVEGKRSYGLENVTHWMPLPDMPNSSLVGGNGEKVQTLIAGTFEGYDAAKAKFFC